MRLLVIGAAGRLGTCLVEQAIEHGHEPISFVRNPNNYGTSHTRLTLVKGDVLDAASVQSAVEQCHVVLAAIAPKLKFRQKTQIFSRGVENLLNAFSRSRRRLVWVTTAGVDPQDLAATGFFFSRIFKPLFLEGVYTDCALSESKLKGSTAEWIVIHPTRLTNRPRTGNYRVDPWHTPARGKELFPVLGTVANKCLKPPLAIRHRNAARSRYSVIPMNSINLSSNRFKRSRD